MAHNKIILFFIFFISVALYAQEPDNTVKTDSVPKYSYATVPELWKQIDDIFNDPNFNNANWGVIIQSLETGEYFYKRNEDKLFIPASNLKLITTAAAFQILGTDYTYQTNVYTNGRIDGSILEGDIIVVGSGDPTISGRFYNQNIYQVFENWADSLIAAGIDEINGNIIGDDNNFDDAGLGAGWSWDYESYWFAAPSGAISFNDNIIDITVSAREGRNKAEILVQPNTRYVTVINNVEVLSGDSAVGLDVYRERGTNVISVFGSINPNSVAEKIYATVNNPTQYAMVVLKEVLERRGIIVRGFPIDIDDLPYSVDYINNTPLLSHQSPPLRDIVKVINKNSNNLYSEQLMKTIGLEKEGFGSIETGVKAVNQVLREMGINPESLNIADGSGLSHMNLISPRHLLSVLTYMYKSKNFVSFINSLPVAGVDGTLGKRMKNTRAESKVRAKTGYLNHIRSLSGYAYTGDNEPVAFSIIVNNFIVPVKLAENLQDLVCLRLSNFRRK